MQIRKKIFITLFSLCLASLALPTAVGIYQLARAKTDLNEAQQTQSEALTDTNIALMTAVNQAMVTTLAQACSLQIESELTGIERQLQAIQNYAREVYQHGAETVTRFPDAVCYLQPGVSFAEVASEFRVMASLCDVIAGTMAADPALVIYYVSESGFLLTGMVVDYSPGEEIDRRGRPWYTETRQRRALYWSSIYTDIYSGEWTVTAAVPVITEDGQFRGVVACDLMLGPLIDEVLSAHPEAVEYVFLADGQGEEFAGSLPGARLTDFLSDEKSTLQLAAAMRGQMGGIGLYQDAAAMVGYTTVPVTGWRVGAVMDYPNIIAPAQRMGAAIDEARSQLQAYLDGKIRSAVSVSALTAAGLLVLAAMVSRRAAQTITQPLRLLTEGVNKISGGNLTHHIALESGDEFERLANDFNRMTHRLREYIAHLAAVTADRERIAAELNVAADIQRRMLPCLFPPYPDRDGLDIYGFMRPAKEVGGDFFDFFWVDEDRLCLIIADVSGKGVPAALFMVIAKTLIKNNAQVGKEPAAVFEAVNQQLCENNDASMFVTVFMGILDVSSGTFTYVNAGHNAPLWLRQGQGFDWLPVRRDFVLAAMPETRYQQSQTVIAEGDMLFFYTDGVTEAMNRQKVLYSERALWEEINKHTSEAPEQLLGAMNQALDVFTDGAEQADDITMLAIKINKREAAL